MSGPKCLHCGKLIAKDFRSLSFIPATHNGRANGDREGTRHVTVYLDSGQRPKTKEEAQRFTNHEITRVVMSQEEVYEITWWEGDYKDAYFHSQTCAAAFGRRMARLGYR